MELERLFAHAEACTTAFTQHCHDLDWPERPARLLSHIALAEATWLARIEGTPPPSELFDILAAEDILQRTADHRQRLIAELRERPLAIITYRRRNQDQVTSSVSEIATHLITHGFHHRGQIAAWCAEHGHPAPDADLISFFRTDSRS